MIFLMKSVSKNNENGKWRYDTHNNEMGWSDTQSLHHLDGKVHALTEIFS